MPALPTRRLDARRRYGLAAWSLVLLVLLVVDAVLNPGPWKLPGLDPLWPRPGTYALFFTHDRDGDGNIGKEEFINMLISMEVLSPLSKVGQSARAPAPQKEGAAPAAEEEETPAILHLKARQVFDEMDTDDSGFLSANEFVEAYHHFVVGAGFEQVVRDEVELPPWLGGAGASDVTLSKVDERSKVCIRAIKWEAGVPGEEAEPLTFLHNSSTKLSASPLHAWLEKAGVKPTLGAGGGAAAAAAAGGGGSSSSESAPKPKHSVWLDVRGPLHKDTLSTLKTLGLDCATSTDFQDEGVWFKGDMVHHKWGTSGRLSAGVTVPTLWLAGVPFRSGSTKAAGCCKRAFCINPDVGAAQKGRRSLHYRLCGSRQGTVLVTPNDSATNHHAIYPEDRALACFWADTVGAYSAGVKDVVKRAAEATDAAVKVHVAPVSRKQVRNDESAKSMIEAMTLGGEFHLVSKTHLRARPPFFVHSQVGVFFLEGGGGLGPDVVVTVRPFSEDGIAETVLDGYRQRLLTPEPDGDEGGAKTGRQLFVESLSGRLLAAAMADSLGVRFNDLAFRLLGHWAAVLDVALHEQPNSLHQRHMIKLKELAAKLIEYAQKLVESQEVLYSQSAASATIPFFEIFKRRAEHVKKRAEILVEKAEKLEALYQTRLDEDRNWMTTALTLFTAGTWPLSFLTGYFGMCVRYRFAVVHTRHPAPRLLHDLPPPPHTPRVRAPTGTLGTWWSWATLARTRPSRAWTASTCFGYSSASYS